MGNQCSICVPKNVVETFEPPTIITSGNSSGHTSGTGTSGGTYHTGSSFSSYHSSQKSSDLDDNLVEHFVKVDLHKLHVSDSSATSSLMNVDGVPRRRKSILKRTRSNSISPPAKAVSAEQIMEKAIEHTLNFLHPQRRYTARKRILENAYNWWSEESPSNSNSNSESELASRRHSRSVHFQDLETRPTLVIVDDELYRRSSIDSLLHPAVNIIPPTPTTSLPGLSEEEEATGELTKSAKLKLKWRTLSRLLQCVSGFKHFEHNLQRCMSDPELASRVRDNDSLFSDKYTQHSI